MAERQDGWTTARLRLRWAPLLQLQLLGPDDVRVARVQGKQGARLSAPACAGCPLLLADL